jgi:Ca2+-binding EF-hand superfamily protein
MAFYGVGLDIKIKELNMKFKMHLQKKGGIGLRSLAHIFKRMDFNGNKKLDAMEFEEALGSFGLFPTKVELQALVKYYDTDQDGSVSFEEFISGLRDELSERRQAMVQKAFNILDKDGSGFINVHDVKDIYDVRQNQDYINGVKSKEEIICEFLNNFESARGNDDGQVSH